MTEIASRLKAIRKHRQLSRAGLAFKCGGKISSRQIHRIESGKSKKPRQNTVNVLADGLGVSVVVLTGESPLPTYISAGVPPRVIEETVEVGGDFRPELRLAFDLVQSRYGWNDQRIIALAPLMFVLLVERCIAWQAQRIEDLRDSLNRRDERLSSRVRAIIDQDVILQPVELSGNMLPEQFIEVFQEYLLTLATGIPVGLAEPMLTEDVWGGPQGRVCEADLGRITGNSPEARWALEFGDAFLNDIPKELTSDEATVKRVKWLERRLSEEVKSMIRERKQAGLPVGPRSIQKWHTTQRHRPQRD